MAVDKDRSPMGPNPSGRIQRILSLIIFKLRLTTFIKANDSDDLLIQLKPKHQMAKRLRVRNVQGRTDEGAKRP